MPRGPMYRKAEAGPELLRLAGRHPNSLHSCPWGPEAGLGGCCSHLRAMQPLTLATLHLEATVGRVGTEALYLP